MKHSFMRLKYKFSDLINFPSSTVNVFAVLGNFILILFISIAFLQSCIEVPQTEQNTNTGNFEALWKIIDTRYCYLDYKHINWDSVHAVYKLRVNDTLSQLSFYGLMADMLDELKDGHVNLYTNFAVSSYRKWYTDFPSNFNADLIYTDRYLGSNYYSVNGLQYARIHNDDIGYIYYGNFSNRFGNSNIAAIFSYFKGCKGLIIDVRDNGGGYLDMSEQFTSYFLRSDTITGYIMHKTGDGHNDFSVATPIINPANKTLQWQHQVVVLTNRMSFSATNSFIVRMKIAPNVTIIGDRTGGGGGLPFSSEIPNGWMVRFSASPMFDAAMNHTEWGINPDVKVNLKASDIEKGYDTIIERAIMLIESNSGL